MGPLQGASSLTDRDGRDLRTATKVFQREHRVDARLGARVRQARFDDVSGTGLLRYFWMPRHGVLAATFDAGRCCPGTWPTQPSPNDHARCRSAPFSLDQRM